MCRPFRAFASAPRVLFSGFLFYVQQPFRSGRTCPFPGHFITNCMFKVLLFPQLRWRPPPLSFKNAPCSAPRRSQLFLRTVNVLFSPLRIFLSTDFYLFSIAKGSFTSDDGFHPPFPLVLSANIPDPLFAPLLTLNISSLLVIPSASL